MEPMPKPGPKTVERLESIARAMPGVAVSKMFGLPALKTGTKVFACAFGDAMTFKLGPEDLAKALRLKGVELFEPMPGRAMKEWALVPIAQAKRWPELAEQAWRYVAR